MGELVPYGKGKGKSIPDQQKPQVRRTIDYGSNVVRWFEESLARHHNAPALQCHYSFTKELMPPFATPMRPYDGICCRFVHSACNRNRAPVNVVHWFPNGRRLISGSQTGEMTIWNGFQFQFENILQAHNSAIKALEWTPEETVLVSGDQLGVIKFWDQYMYNFQTWQAHKESVCDISIAPTGLKFCSCADESHAKVWDLRTGEEERAFTGHGWDVKSCDWHPTKGLVATGSKDAQIKLWDPRAGEAITTIFCHKNTVTRVKWSPSGQFLASGSRDQLVMLMDIRTMSVRKVFKAHSKEVTSLCWHPETDSLLASGGYDSQLHFWDTMGAAEPIKSLPAAHEGPIWSLAWHPLGHLLVSGSNDYSTRFWSRARPGDKGFDELLPKRTAAPGDIRDSDLPPVPPIPKAVLEAGIFAGAPPKEPPTDCKVMEGAKDPAKLALANEPAGLVPGLSLGGAGILDTSDFDALEDRAVPPVMHPPPSEITEAVDGKPHPVGGASKAETPEASAVPSKVAADVASSPAAPAEKAFSKAAAPPPEPAAPKAAAPALPTAAAGAATEAAETEDPSSVKRAAPDAEAEEKTEPDGKKPRTDESEASK